MPEQLVLDWEMPPPSRLPAWRIQQDEWIAAGILRHHTVMYEHDEHHHSARLIIIEWETADGDMPGTLRPAVLCCLCGWPELNAFHVDLSHSCASGAFGHARPRVGRQFYLQDDWPTPRPHRGQCRWYPMLAERLPPDGEVA